MIHGITNPIVVTGPTKIKPLEAALFQLRKTDVDSKFLHISPALRMALRDYVAELEDNVMVLEAELRIAERQIKELVYSD